MCVGDMYVNRSKFDKTHCFLHEIDVKWSCLGGVCLVTFFDIFYRFLDIYIQKY